jgi:hypothetical protein
MKRTVQVNVKMSPDDFQLLKKAAEKKWPDAVMTNSGMSHLCLVKLTIHIVQPGLSKSRATHDQLELLSVTESHLAEIYGVPFVVIGSR